MVLGAGETSQLVSTHCIQSRHQVKKFRDGSNRRGDPNQETLNS